MPTPVDRQNVPDLSAVRAACRAIGPALGKGAIVVLESTVYPGATEEVVGPTLAESSGLAAGTDFFLGYSPERVNPGDRRALAGADHQGGRRPDPGGRGASGRGLRPGDRRPGVPRARHPDRRGGQGDRERPARHQHRLRQRGRDDLPAPRPVGRTTCSTPPGPNGIFSTSSPASWAVTASGSTPSTWRTRRPRSVTIPRSSWPGARSTTACRPSSPTAWPSGCRPGARILALGLTFKENVPDLRNSKAAELILALFDRGFAVSVHDPLADPAEALALYGLQLLDRLPVAGAPSMRSSAPCRTAPTPRSMARRSPACSARTAWSPTSRACGAAWSCLRACSAGSFEHRRRAPEAAGRGTATSPPSPVLTAALADPDGGP